MTNHPPVANSQDADSPREGASSSPKRTQTECEDCGHLLHWSLDEAEILQCLECGQEYITLTGAKLGQR